MCQVVLQQIVLWFWILSTVLIFFKYNISEAGSVTGNRREDGMNSYLARPIKKKELVLVSGE